MHEIVCGSSRDGRTSSSAGIRNSAEQTRFHYLEAISGHQILSSMNCKIHAQVQSLSVKHWDKTGGSNLPISLEGTNHWNHCVHTSDCIVITGWLEPKMHTFGGIWLVTGSYPAPPSVEVALRKTPDTAVVVWMSVWIWDVLGNIVKCFEWPLVRKKLYKCS